MAKAKLTEAQDAMATLEEAITYITIAHGKDSQITEFLMQQAKDIRQSVEKMVDNSVIKKALGMTYMLTIITKHKQQEEIAKATKVTKSLLHMMGHLCKVWTMPSSPLVSIDNNTLGAHLLETTFTRHSRFEL